MDVHPSKNGIFIGIDPYPCVHDLSGPMPKAPQQHPGGAPGGACHKKSSLVPLPIIQ